MHEDVKKTPSPEEYTEEYYLTRCGGYKEYLKDEMPLRHKQALKYLNPLIGEVVLDIGCGRGELIQKCNENGCRAVGIDYSPVAAKLSKKIGNQATIIQASATALPFRHEVFDKILMLDIVEHLSMDDLLQSLCEARRVLKNSGHIIIHTPNIWGDRVSEFFYGIFHKFRTMIGRSKHTELISSCGDMHVNVLSPISLKLALRRTGYNSCIWFAKDPLQEVPWWWALTDRLLFFLTTIWCKAWKK